MEDSNSTVIQPKLSSNSKINNESEYKSAEDLLENYEIKNALESINNFNEEHSKEQKRKEDNGNGLICTNIKDIDWLSNIFINKDIKNMLIQNNHIREIDQALYYFIIFSKIFLTWSKERETDKLIKEEQKERDKQKQKYHVNLPPIDMKKLLKKIVIPRIKVGVIGCGNIGKKLLKNLIKVKDKKIIDFQIQVSTRQPEKVMSELLDLLSSKYTTLSNVQIFRRQGMSVRKKWYRDLY